MTDLLDSPSRHSVFVRIHTHADRWFARWGSFSFRHPWLVIATWLLIVAGLATQLPHLQVETSVESFVHDDDPQRLTYNQFRHQFGRDERLLMLVESPTGDIFNLPFLEKLRDVHRELEQAVPHLQGVDSLINARLTRGEGDELIVKDFLEDWPQTEAELAALKARALANPLYVDQFVSADARYAVLMIRNDAYSSAGQEPVDELAGFDELAAPGPAAAGEERPFLTGPENTEIVLAAEAVAERYHTPDFHISFAGTPFMVDKLTRLLIEDMARFMLISVMVVMVLLALAYRRAVMVFLPMTVSVLSMVATMGTMSALGMPVDGAVQIMPSFLITIGISNAVHLFTIFFQAANRGCNKHDALVYALEHSGTAILMTGLTTIFGLASFVTSAVKPVANFGFITPIGVANTLLASLTLLPALIAVTPFASNKATVLHSGKWNQRVLQACGELAIRNPWKVIAAWTVLIVLGLGLATQMRLSHDPMKWFPEGHPLRVATDIINKDLAGGMFMEILVDTGQENGVQDPDLLKRIDQASQALAAIENPNARVGKIVSIIDVVKETNQALHGNDPAYYTIPDDRALVAQELLLFENSGSDDLTQMVDSQFSKARITLTMPFVDAIHYPAFQDQVEPIIRDTIGDKAEVTLTGLLVLMGKNIYNLIISMSSSYITSFFMISALMIFFLGSVRIGMLSMIGNVVPIIITLGLMVLMDTPLDAFTLLIGCIALSLAVDDTVHFMNNFRRYMHRYQDPERAIRETLATAGEAMWFTSLVLTAGFLVYLFASMQNLFYFGLLTACSIVVALLADILLNPAIMLLYSRRQLRKAGLVPVQP